MEHVCNSWCRGQVHAILFTQTSTDLGTDYSRANAAAEALLSVAGLVAVGEYGIQAMQAGLAPGELGFQRYWVFGRKP
jgi:hypothetical protein